ncbi:translation initiation factor IF-2-like isoform X2 [Limulus polyphemus]|uniref:Translation initiation factor IF-2-like isoform X2 n=1 Tax=Limulus polyphemus TaxID=6850 RepID=A0ABM1T4M2_LIMPO|nr:translation initiation factor IF-2-like isoform X2 [Limulus polyphemus]
MPKRVLKSLYSRKSKIAKRMAERRSQETAKETAARQAQDRERIARRRAQETADETASRQARDRERIARRRAQETAGETAATQKGNLGRMTKRRVKELVAEIAARREQSREYQAQRRVAAAEWRPRMYFKTANDYDPNHDYESESAYDVGKRSIECDFCRTKRYPNEKAGLCCDNGKVELQPLRESPPPLNVLLQGNIEESKNFLTNIRKYNNVFQMTSFGAGTIITEPGYQTLGETSVEYEMSVTDAVMEVLEIKVEPFYDDEQNALLNMELMENEEKNITSSSATVEALSLCKGASHAVHRSVVPEEGQENNCVEVTRKTENTLVKVKTEPPGEL